MRLEATKMKKLREEEREDASRLVRLEKKFERKFFVYSLLVVKVRDTDGSDLTQEDVHGPVGCGRKRTGKCEEENGRSNRWFLVVDSRRRKRRATHVPIARRGMLKTSDWYVQEI